MFVARMSALYLSLSSGDRFVRTRIIEENLHVKFSEETHNIAGSGPEWLFDIDTLTKSINYKPVVAWNQTNGNAGEEEKKDDEDPMNKEEPRVNQENDASVNSTNSINTVSSTVNVVGIEDNAVDENIVYGCEDDPNMPNLEKIYLSGSDEGRAQKGHPSITRSKLDRSYAGRASKDDRGIVVRNKARLVALGYTQEEGIDYDEVFALVARIEVIRLFLAYASFMNFIVYQMDVKSAFLYGTIEEEVYVCQPPGFEDPKFPNKVYNVKKGFIWFTSSSLDLYERPTTYLLENRFRRGTIDKTLFIKKDKGNILLVQVYVDDIIFGSTKKSLCTEFEHMMHKRFQMSYMGELTFFLGLQTTSTPIETNKALLKDEEAADVDVHLYRSMIGSLMYLTASRPNIMFAVCACARKSTTGGCQFLRRRLISWQCKKQTIVANSTTEAEYVATANCCGQVLWIQNQLLDYGYNFMNTKVFIDSESTICIVTNPVFHSTTKHIKIRHHFIRDSYEKRLIQVIKIYTDHNVADLLTKAFDVIRFQYLIASIGMLNL
ncbi:putative ribonuclease H-like domain-containing protein [Tanacetum coccineum]